MPRSRAAAAGLALAAGLAVADLGAGLIGGLVDGPVARTAADVTATGLGTTVVMMLAFVTLVAVPVAWQGIRAAAWAAAAARLARLVLWALFGAAETTATTVYTALTTVAVMLLARALNRRARRTP